MKIVMQRVRFAEVLVRKKVVSRIDQGLFLLLGFSKKDEGINKLPVWDKIINKIPQLRIFPDKDGKLNLTLNDINGDILVVSQFTLYGDIKRGRRPSFTDAAPYDMARKLYDKFVCDISNKLTNRVKQGVFGEEMEIKICNFGPVTLIIDSDKM